MFMLTNQYEQEAQRAARNRARGYAFLWLFLGIFVMGLSIYTGRNYPMDTSVSVILLTIGGVKLVRLLIPDGF